MSIKVSEIEERMVTAMCLWENFLVLRKKTQYLHLLGISIVDARYQVAALVVDCHKAWRKIEAQGDDAVEDASPYDLGFCQEFLIKNLHRITNRR